MALLQYWRRPLNFNSNTRHTDNGIKSKHTSDHKCLLSYQIFTLDNNTILGPNDALNEPSLTLIFAPYYHNLCYKTNMQNEINKINKVKVRKDNTRKKKWYWWVYVVPSENFPVPNEFLSCFPTHFNVALYNHKKIKEKNNN